MTEHVPATTISIPSLRKWLGTLLCRSVTKLDDLHGNVVPIAVCLLGLVGLVFPSLLHCLVSLSLAAMVLCALIALPVAGLLVFAGRGLGYLERTWLKTVISSFVERLDTSLPLRINAFWNSVLRHWAQIEADLRRRCLSSIGAPAVTLVPRLVPTPSFLHA